MEKIKILDAQEIQKELQGLPGWQYLNGRLVKTYKFEQFLDVICLINALAPFFEEINHHADIEIEHRKITFKLWRFDIGMKVTNYDILSAKRIEELAGQIYQND